MIKLLRLALLVRSAPRLPDEEWKHVRRAVLLRDDGRCQLRRLWGWGPKCGRQDDSMHVDHVVPKAWGGGDGPDNLRAACPPCNLAKGSRPPAGWLMLRVVRAAAVYGVLVWGAVQFSETARPAIQGSPANAEQRAAGSGAWAAVVSAEQAAALEPGDPGVYWTRAEAERAADAWNGFGGDGSPTWFVVEIEIERR